MKLFLKSTINSRSIFSDFWVIMLSGFIFSFILLFTSSLLSCLDDLNSYFISPNVIVNETACSRDEIIKDLDNLRALDEVERADLISRQVGIIENGDFYARVLLNIVTEEYFDKKRIGIINLKMSDEEVKNPLIISNTLAMKYGIKMGDKVAFVSSPSKRARLLSVAGLYDTGLEEFDSNMCFEVSSQDVMIANAADSPLSIWFERSGFENKFRLYKYNLFSSGNKSPLDYDLFSGVVDYHKLTEGRVDENLFQSFNSIKFILFLFALIMLSYFFVAINNFNIRNTYNFRVFDVLGESNLFLYKCISCTLMTLLSMLIGVFLGASAAMLTPSVMNYLSRNQSVNFGYYITHFRVDLANSDLLFFIFTNTLLAFVIYFFLFKVKKALH